MLTQQHSTTFTLSTINGTVAETSCSANLPAAEPQMLPPVPWTYCTDEQTVWSFVPVVAPGGNASYYALLLADAARGLVGTKVWGAGDFPVVDQVTSPYQNYSGPADFDV